MFSPALIMSSLIQQIARQAYKTFHPSQSRGPTSDNLHQLSKLADQLRGEDVQFNIDRLEKRSDNGTCAPVTYLHIWEDDVFTMGIFILRQGCSIPLHDHPGMYGLCKVIHGTITVKSYHPVDNRIVPAHLQKYRYLQATTSDVTTEISADDKCCVLTPRERNYHELRAAHGPAAFLDILAPPYQPMAGRNCHYYTELVTEDGVTWLKPIPEPREFRCDWGMYRGPSVNPKED